MIYMPHTADTLPAQLHDTSKACEMKTYLLYLAKNGMDSIGGGLLECIELLDSAAVHFSNNVLLIQSILSADEILGLFSLFLNVSNDIDSDVAMVLELSKQNNAWEGFSKQDEHILWSRLHVYPHVH